MIRSTGVNKEVVAASLLMSLAACHSPRASKQEIDAARTVLHRYLEAWRVGAYDEMFRLTSTRRIRELTDLNPGAGSAHRRQAARRFALVADQTKRYMNYVTFEVTRVVASRPGLVVFEVQPRDASDRERGTLLFRLRATEGGWKVD